MNDQIRREPQFYFSLLRFLAWMRGADSRRVEKNGVEAWLGGLGINLISYLFFAQFIPTNLALWQSVAALVCLAFFVWLFWVVVLYLDSLLIRLLRPLGIFRNIPVRRAQSILLGTWTTAMACGSLQAGTWQGEIAAIWILAVAMNLTAAAILSFVHGPHRAKQ